MGKGRRNDASEAVAVRLQDTKGGAETNDETVYSLDRE